MFFALNNSTTYSGFFLFGLTFTIFNLVQLNFEINKPLKICFFDEIVLPGKFNNLCENMTLLFEDNESESDSENII